MFRRRTSSGGALRRFDGAHTRHTGLTIVQRAEHRQWEITIEHSVTGVTLRRDRYNAIITDNTAARDERLDGFSSYATALQAAYRRIDFILDIRDPAPVWKQAV